MLLPLTDPLVATFSERDAPNFRKYVAEICIMMENPSKTLETFWSHWSVFALYNKNRYGNFQSIFTSNRPFGGYFQ